MGAPGPEGRAAGFDEHLDQLVRCVIPRAL